MISNLPDWTEGIKKTLAKHNARLPELYSWHAIDEDGSIIFITEADHREKNNSIVKLKDGYIERNIPPAGKDWSHTTIRHAGEVLSAVKLAYSLGLPVKVLLTRNTRYSETPKKPTKAMLLPWKYKITEYRGEFVENGFSFRLEKI